MPTKTKAAVAFAPGEPLRVIEVDLADPGPGQVMVRLLATGLCHSDLHVIDGVMEHNFPVILGHEGAGDVVAIGPGVTDFAPGDRVIPYLIPDCGTCAFCRSGRTNLCAQFAARRNSARSPFSLNGRQISSFMELGTFAETTVVAADSLVKIDPAARPDHACCIGCGVTTGLGSALLRAKIGPGETVAVFGAGGVGLSVVQGARLAGAARIIVVDTNPAKAGIARKLGATDFLLPGEVENVVAHIIGLTGMGADFAFDCVGIPALAQLALDCVNPAWGVAICVGVMAAGARVSANPSALFGGRVLTGSLMGGAKRQDVARFVDMYQAGDINLDDVVSHHLTLEEINRGFEMMRSGEAVRTVVEF